MVLVMLKKLFSALFKSGERGFQEPKRLYWMNENAKINAIFEEAQKHSNVTILVWFEDLYDKLKSYKSTSSARIERAEYYLSSPGSMRGEVVLLADTYPLLDPEMQIINVLYRSEVETIIVYSSLDEAVFEIFGSDRILDILDTLGMKESESIEHRMIDKSVARARQKIAEKMSGPDRKTKTATEWFTENYRP